jgi:hypothetical protein
MHKKTDIGVSPLLIEIGSVCEVFSIKSTFSQSDNFMHEWFIHYNAPGTQGVHVNVS